MTSLPAYSGPSSPKFTDVVSVEMTSACNLDCPMCPRSLSSAADRPKALLPRKAFDHLLEASSRISHLNLNGLSENLLHPGFLDMLEELDRLGVLTSFSTIGILLSKEVATRVARLTHLATVNVSIDSADPDEYRRIRGGDLARARAGLANLVSASGGALRVTASAVVMEMGARGVPLLPEFVAGVGVRNLILQTVVDPNETAPPLRLPPDARRIVEEVKSRGAALDVNVLAVPFLMERIEAAEMRARGENGPDPARPTGEAGHPITKACTAPWSHLAVDCYGRVFPCCNSPSWVNLVGPEGLVLGDLSRETFEEVWTGDRMRAFREKLVTGNLPPVCRICPVVPEGVHPFLEYAAEILPEECFATPQGVTVGVRNRGSAVWTAQSELYFAPSHPRERESQLRSKSWPSRNRAARMREERVASGERATFDVELTRPASDQPEVFGLVVEGKCWLPGTDVAIVPLGRLHPVPLARLSSAVRPAVRHSTEAAPVRSEGREPTEVARLKAVLERLEMELSVVKAAGLRLDTEVVAGPCPAKVLRASRELLVARLRRSPALMRLARTPAGGRLLRRARSAVRLFD